MKTYVHLLYLTQFFLEWEMFQTKDSETIKAHILRWIFYYRKSYHLWDNVEEHGTARQATDDNVIRRVRVACWVTKANTHTHTHSEYVILIVFPRQQWSRKRSYVNYLVFANFLISFVHAKYPAPRFIHDTGSSRLGSWDTNSVVSAFSENY
jgi:hypothetical protein